MSGGDLLIGLVIGVVCGGFLGVAWDRWSRRDDDKRPEYLRRVVHPSRLARMHVIEDEGLQGNWKREDHR